MRKVDKTGMRFYKLVAEERITNYNNTGQTYYKCKCDCGNYTYVKSNKLCEGGTKSCGCARQDFAETRKKDIVGLKFGRLTVKEVVEKGSQVKAICKCDCGTDNVEVFKNNLTRKNGHTFSCGCLQKERVRKRFDNNNLIGKKFNMLEVIEEDFEKEKEKNFTRRYWKCKCECGEIISLTTYQINSERNISCGCIKSKGEYITKVFLHKNNIPYVYEKKYEGLVGINGEGLSYDFYIPSENVLIEIQGEQHEKPVKHFGGKKQFEIQKEHDKRKREYCKNNNIELIEIWYYEYDKIEEILKRFIN